MTEEKEKWKEEKEEKRKEKRLAFTYQRKKEKTTGNMIFWSR